MSDVMAGPTFGLFVHFLTMSLLSVGGAIATVPAIHAHLVDDKRWLSDATFSSSIALAQAAPGPNLLFVPVLGYHVSGMAGAMASLAGMLLPSTLLALTATRWLDARRQSLGVQAFVAGMMPVTLGLLFATGWVLLQGLGGGAQGRWALAAVAAATAVATWRTKWPPLVWVAAGAVLGAMGMV